jgi:hypothetical protein
MSVNSNDNFFADFFSIQSKPKLCFTRANVYNFVVTELKNRLLQICISLSLIERKNFCAACGLKKRPIWNRPGKVSFFFKVLPQCGWSVQFESSEIYGFKKITPILMRMSRWGAFKPTGHQKTIKIKFPAAVCYFLFSGCSILSRQSFHSSPVLALSSWLSCPSILSWLPCPGCPFLTVPSRLSCSVSSVLLSFHDCPFMSWLSFLSCLVLVVVIPLEIFLRKLSHS